MFVLHILTSFKVYSCFVFHGDGTIFFFFLLHIPCISELERDFFFLFKWRCLDPRNMNDERKDDEFRKVFHDHVMDMIGSSESKCRENVGRRFNRIF